MNRFALCLVLMSMPVLKIHAQDIHSSKLKWSSIGSEDIKTSSRLAQSCYFVTADDQQVEWLQRNGTVAQRFGITERKGTWQDIKQAGKVTYTVSQDGSQGQIIFERTSKGVFVTIDFSKGNPYGIRQRFTIEEVNPIAP
ncbi:MAG: hypothetical protein KF687_15760 [Cyclobacteriaceae bacterium]|nr:hypothetical protein [Cyclobacteriaceae bacterium]